MSATDASGVSADHFATNKKLVIVIDLANWVRSTRGRDDLDLARFADAWYAQLDHELTAAGVRVVKFMGDACLATADPDSTGKVVRALDSLAEQLVPLAAEYRLGVTLGANLHIAPVVEGDFHGPDGTPRYDLMGTGVNQTFLLGAGVGIRLSERAYRALPSGDRTPWSKQQPPAVYTRD